MKSAEKNAVSRTGTIVGPVRRSYSIETDHARERAVDGAFESEEGF